MGLAALPVVAWAEAEGDCRLAADPRLDLHWARVVGIVPVHFVKDASDGAGCPAEARDCRTKAFVIGGDHVIVGRRHWDYVCVGFVGKTGDQRTGWLPAAATRPEVMPPTAIADWVGRWSMTEAEIAIVQTPDGRLKVDGNATYGARDPDRVKRGAVNMGSIEGTMAPHGSKLSFTMGANGAMPAARADDQDCTVWMQRVGPYLAVDDNYACGGMNVTFSGVYRRR